MSHHLEPREIGHVIVGKYEVVLFERKLSQAFYSIGRYLYMVTCAFK